jgi:hypothetical protein
MKKYPLQHSILISIYFFLWENEDKDKTTSTKDVNYYNSENYLTLKHLITRKISQFL